MLVLIGPVESAHDLGRFGCVLAELHAMVCGMCGGSLALLNAGVRGARLLLAEKLASSIKVKLIDFACTLQRVLSLDRVIRSVSSAHLEPFSSLHIDDCFDYAEALKK